MLIDLPGPSSISNSTSISNSNLINNQSLPCQVDASTSNLSKGKSLNNDNGIILHEEPSSISSLNSINSIQSNVNHDISNLPGAKSPILCSSSLSPSDLDEVMLIDLPCPSSISNSTSISNLNLINNQTLPCQVDASNSASTFKISLTPSISKVKKNKSLQGTSKSLSKGISKPKHSKSSKSILSYFKKSTKSKQEEVEDLIEIVWNGNNSQEKIPSSYYINNLHEDQNNSAEKFQSSDSNLNSISFKNILENVHLPVVRKKGNNSLEPTPSFIDSDIDRDSHPICICNDQSASPSKAPSSSNDIVLPKIYDFSQFKKSKECEIRMRKSPPQNAKDPHYVPACFQAVNEHLPYSKEENLVAHKKGNNSDQRIGSTPHHVNLSGSSIFSISKDNLNVLRNSSLSSITKKGNNSIPRPPPLNVSKNLSMSLSPFKDVFKLDENEIYLESDYSVPPRKACNSNVEFGNCQNKSSIYKEPTSGLYNSMVNLKEVNLFSMVGKLGGTGMLEDFHPLSSYLLEPSSKVKLSSPGYKLVDLKKGNNSVLQMSSSKSVISTSIYSFNSQLQYTFLNSSMLNYSVELIYRHDNPRNLWDTIDFHPVSNIYIILSKIFTHLNYRSDLNALLTWKRVNNSGDRGPKSDSRECSLTPVCQSSLSKFYSTLRKSDILPHTENQSNTKNGNNSKERHFDFHPVSPSFELEQNLSNLYKCFEILDVNKKGNNSQTTLPAVNKLENAFESFLRLPDVADFHPVCPIINNKIDVQFLQKKGINSIFYESNTVQHPSINSLLPLYEIYTSGLPIQGLTNNDPTSLNKLPSMEISSHEGKLAESDHDLNRIGKILQETNVSSESSNSPCDVDFHPGSSSPISFKIETKSLMTEINHCNSNMGRHLFQEVGKNCHGKSQHQNSTNNQSDHENIYLSNSNIKSITLNDQYYHLGNILNNDGVDKSYEKLHPLVYYDFHPESSITQRNLFYPNDLSNVPSILKDGNNSHETFPPPVSLTQQLCPRESIISEPKIKETLNEIPMKQKKGNNSHEKFHHQNKFGLGYKRPLICSTDSNESSFCHPINLTSIYDDKWLYKASLLQEDSSKIQLLNMTSNKGTKRAYGNDNGENPHEEPHVEILNDFHPVSSNIFNTNHAMGERVISKHVSEGVKNDTFLKDDNEFSDSGRKWNKEYFDLNVVNQKNALHFNVFVDETKIKEGGVMEDDDVKGGVKEKNKLKVNMFVDETEKEEGGVMRENDLKGGVYELKLNMFANETGIEEGGVMVEGDKKGG
ncbi:hypothetical protein ROZALSC1DRAFT_23973, partial [Rozella allomycis CSF55]